MSTPKLALKFALEPKTGPAPQLVPAPCFDKQRLRDELRATMDQIIALVNRRLEAVRFGAEPGMEQFLEGQIAHARRRKDSLLELYKSHVERHSY